MSNFTKKCMACWTLPDSCPAGHTFLWKFWHFQMAVSCLVLYLFTPNLVILWILVCSFRLCRSIVANPIIYRLVLSPPTYEIRQWRLTGNFEFTSCTQLRNVSFGNPLFDTNKKRKQSLESAQCGLEIVFKSQKQNLTISANWLTMS